VSRGELWWVNLDPAIRSKAATLRPALIVGRETLARAAMGHEGGTVTVVPVTSATAKVYAFQVLIPSGLGGLDKASKAQAEQIRTVSVSRLVERIGVVPEATSRRVDDAIRMYLGL